MCIYVLNVLINILSINCDLHLLEIWELHQDNCIGNYLFKYPPAVMYEEKHRLCTKNKLIRRRGVQLYQQEEQ